jgi:enoyl-CoA hydratase
MNRVVEFVENDRYSLIRMDDGKANAIDFVILDQLDEALNRAEVAGKVLVITGRPGKFCAGFDLSIMRAGGDDMNRLLQGGAELAQRWLKFATPIVLAVSGHALAMGGLLLLSADYRIGMRGDFKYGLNEVAIGLTMPRFGVEIARGRLSHAYFGRSVACANLFDFQEAKTAGFLDEICAPDELMSQSAMVAEQLATLDLVAYRETKARVWKYLYVALEEAIKRDFMDQNQAI